MDLLQTKGLFSVRVHRRIHLVAALLLTACCGLVAGCGSKDAETTAVAPGSLKGQAPAVPTTVSTPTPEQEAAKQKAIQQGPSIEAALDAQRSGQPAPK